MAALALCECSVCDCPHAVPIPDSASSDEYGEPICDDCFDGNHIGNDAAYCGKCGMTHAGVCSLVCRADDCDEPLVDGGDGYDGYCADHSDRRDVEATTASAGADRAG